MTIRVDRSGDDPPARDDRPRIRRVLVTGGAGFIGIHVARELLDHGHAVRVLDALLEQVHGTARWPPQLPADVERREARVGNRERLREALADVDAVVHLAARVGVGQSMYRMAEYVRSNGLATAVLVEEILEADVRRLVVASSMSVYGEGACVFPGGRPAPRAGRREDRLRRAQWDPVGPGGAALRPVPTDESVAPDLASVYALSKFDQERLCLLAGEAYGIPTFALRLFNVYGRHQALSNPYTGVLAIFAARLMNGRPPLVYEDGHQRRDFVHVTDVARAFRLALEAPVPPRDRIVNVGSGESRTVREVADHMAALMGRPDLKPEITGRFRRGDVRHCFADIGRARRVLGFEPRMTFADGLADLAAWLRDQEADDGAVRANRELERRGLVV